jgi:DnaJ-class molecular chaperone
MRDPYTVLGLARGASAEDIKKAFRKKAKLLHPDRNTADPKAQERFSELNNAHELLADVEKRAAFDRGEIDAEGKPRFTGHDPFAGGGRRPGGMGGGPQNGNFENFSFNGGDFRQSSGRGGPSGFADIFADLMGGRGGQQGDPFAGQGQGPRTQAPPETTLTTTVSFLQAGRGTSQRILLPSGENLDVTIPAGTRDGDRLRLRGKGERFGGRAADAFLAIKVEPHKAFRLQGNDLYLDLPIALDEAVLGGAVRVPLLQGAVDLTLPAMTQAGKTFRLKGKGWPLKDGPGDLYVTVRVVLPEKADAELTVLCQRLQAQRLSNPRDGLL